jgi:tRNA(Ile)-lysidine synthase
LGVECIVARPASPDGRRGNLQAWARDTRYAIAGDLATARDALVFTGHTASDQVETILYRLAASPGRRAMLGMASRDGRLVRPLLGTTREETTAYCDARGLAWREDASNAGGRFARGRVRHGLLEGLRAVHPAAEANVLRTADLLRAEAAVLEEVLTTALAGRSRIRLDVLSSLPPALSRLVVIRLAEDAGGGFAPGVGARVEEICALASAGGSAELDVGGGVRAIVEYGVLRFESKESTPAPAAVALALPGSVAFGAWRLDAELRPSTGLGDLVRDESVGFLDADRLAGGPLTVRAWRAGDRVRPLGLRGTKTLADLFTDRRVPRLERRGLPVIADAEEIVWVPGVATADGARVVADTVRVAVLTARRI